MSSKVTGIIGADLEGTHYLNTFEGRYLIGMRAINRAANYIKKRRPDKANELMVGRLAQGKVGEHDQIVEIRYLIDGQACPPDQSYCLNCAWRSPEFTCKNHEKIRERHPGLVRNGNDRLIYSYNEDGTFFVEDYFGCVHWKKRD